MRSWLLCLAVTLSAAAAHAEPLSPMLQLPETGERKPVTTVPSERFAACSKSP